VLLADDDGAAVQPLADALRAAGFYVRVAHTGRQALAQLCAARFDILITDIVMPEMDGLELLSWLRRVQSHVPAIALSGDGPDAGALYAKAAVCVGADLTLPRPADPRVVLAAAHRLTGQGRRMPASLDAPAPAA
jgi:DNA-binding response OmpR family regulator